MVDEGNTKSEMEKERFGAGVAGISKLACMEDAGDAGIDMDRAARDCTTEGWGGVRAVPLEEGASAPALAAPVPSVVSALTSSRSRYKMRRVTLPITGSNGCAFCKW